MGKGKGLTVSVTRFKCKVQSAKRKMKESATLFINKFWHRSRRICAEAVFSFSNYGIDLEEFVRKPFSPMPRRIVYTSGIGKKAKKKRP